MANILTKQVGESKFSPLDALMVAGTKIVLENVLSRTFVGNSTVKSGLIKMGGAAASGFLIKNKLGMILGTALVVDGAEDLVRGLLGSRLGLTSSGSTQVVGGSNSNQGQNANSVI